MLKYIVPLPFLVAAAYTMYQEQAGFMLAFIIIGILLYKGFKK